MYLGRRGVARAREEEKPIFLSIELLDRHWCHVMEHESFEDTAVAESSIGVSFRSRSIAERPDVDRVA